MQRLQETGQDTLASNSQIADCQKLVITGKCMKVCIWVILVYITEFIPSDEELNVDISRILETTH
jgi:hypothetical protein